MFDFDDPRKLGLLAAGLAMLSSKGNAGQAIGQGGLLGLQAMQGAKQSRSEEEDRKARREMQQLQMEQLRAQMTRQNRMDTGLDAAASAATVPPMGPPTPDGQMQPGGFDPQKYMNAAMPYLPPQTLLSMMPKRPEPEEFGTKFETINTPEGPKVVQVGKQGTVRPVQGATPYEKPGEKWEPIPAPEGARPGQFWERNAITGQTRAVGSVAPSVTVNNQAPNQFMKGFGDMQADALKEGFTRAQKAGETISVINNAREAIAGGALQGGMATPKQVFLKGMQGLGVEVDPNLVANTDKLKSALKANIISRAKELGTNPSNIDMRLLDEALGGIDTDPRALNRVLDWMESAARKQIQTHNNRYKQVMQQPNAFSAFDMTIPEPERFQSPSAAPAGAPKRLRYNPSTGRVE